MSIIFSFFPVFLGYFEIFSAEKNCRGTGHGSFAILLYRLFSLPAEAGTPPLSNHLSLTAHRGEAPLGCVASDPDVESLSHFRSLFLDSLGSIRQRHGCLNLCSKCIRRNLNLLRRFFVIHGKLKRIDIHTDLRSL